MATVRTYTLVGGRAKIQVEDMLGTNPGGGWVYQAPGRGNNPGAEGAHYYFRSQTADGSVKKAPVEGRFTMRVNVPEAGSYSILLRASRDTANPGDARNDVWIKIDNGTQSVMPKGTPTLTSGGDGFVKFKGAPPAHKWVDAHIFSTSQHGDKNPESTVVFTKGMHTITIAPRSVGYHIDSIQIVKKGLAATELALESAPATKPDVEVASAESDIDVGAASKSIVVGVAGQHGDFESNKAAGSRDLEFGRDEAGPQSVGLRFKGIELDKEADIKSAHFVFTAAETSKGAARFTIEIEEGTDAKAYSRADAPDDRIYLDEDIAWNPGTWEKGKVYKSADIAALIEAVIEEDGLDALDALAFRISGTGERVAEAAETGNGPELVIDWA